MTNLWVKGFVEHPDPDQLVALKFGYHDYKSYDSLKQAYVDGEINELEFEAIVEGWLERADEEEISSQLEL